MTRVPFNVTIIDDNIIESDEIFYLNITTDSLPNGVSVGYPNQTTVTIKDDEGKYLKLQLYFVWVDQSKAAYCTFYPVLIIAT